MQRILTSLLPAVTLVALGHDLSFTSQAFAGVPTPAPIVGAGLPVVAVVGGAYWLYRRYRDRGRKD